MALIIILFGCRSKTLDQACHSYKENRDCASPAIIYRHLERGMKTVGVDRVRGKPGCSPVGGQYYYSSDRIAKFSDGSAPIGIVLDYSD